MTAIVLSDLLRNSGIIKSLNLKEIDSLLEALRVDKDPAILKTMNLLLERRDQLVFADVSKSDKQVDVFSYIAEAVADVAAPVLSAKEEFKRAFQTVYEGFLKFTAGARANGALYFDARENRLSGEAAEQTMARAHDLLSLLPGSRPKVTETDESLVEGDGRKKYDMVFQVPRRAKIGIDNLMRNAWRGDRVFDLNGLLENIWDDCNDHSEPRIPLSFSYRGSTSHLLRNFMSPEAYAGFEDSVSRLREPSAVVSKRPGERFVDGAHVVGSRFL